MRRGPPFRFRSAVHAVSARDYLVQNGVPAEVVGGNSDSALAWGRHSGSYEVLLGASADADLAAYLLEEWASEPMEIDGELDDHALPDLSALPPEMAPPCSNCGKVLPMEASIEACSHCGASVDVAALIVEVHGPEALHDCYESAPGIEGLADAPRSPSACKACGGPIGEQGACGWCGRRKK